VLVELTVGPADWQQALSATLGRWRANLGAEGRIPNGWVRARHKQPALELVTDAGFEVTDSFTFPVEHGWNIAELIGFAYSTSLFPHPIVGSTTCLSRHATRSTDNTSIHVSASTCNRQRSHIGMTVHLTHNQRQSSASV
jgi:hypothetical protein